MRRSQRDRRAVSASYQRRRRASEAREVREQALERHGELVEAVRARDGAAAADALARHLREFGAAVARIENDG